jgi:hypothetical protein
VNYAADQVAEPNSYQTAGKDFKVYVMPDPVYSPSYNAVLNSGLGANAQWTWTYAGLTGAPLTGVAAGQNWVSFTAPAVGVYPVAVAESNTLGGCLDASAISVTINVVAAPIGTISTADPAQACDNQPAASVNLVFTENVPNGNAGYAFGITEIVEEIDATGLIVLNTPVALHSFVDFPTTAKLKTAGATFTKVTPTFTYTFTTSALAVSNSNRTRYTYTLTKASDAPGLAANGVISAISQKSDYGSTVTTYPWGVKTTYVAIVNPTPVTGPIYHISNTYAY